MPSLSCKNRRLNLQPACHSTKNSRGKSFVSREQARLQRSLQFEEETLFFDATAVAAQSAVGAYHAVAGDDYRYGIRTARRTDSPGVGFNPAGQLAVSKRASVGNSSEGFPDTVLMRATTQIQRYVELFPPACKIFIELRDNSLTSAGLSLIAVPTESISRSFEGCRPR